MAPLAFLLAAVLLLINLLSYVELSMSADFIGLAGLHPLYGCFDGADHRHRDS